MIRHRCEPPRRELWQDRVDGMNERLTSGLGGIEDSGRLDTFKRIEAFNRIETWVFDLDNTLYPHHLNLWQQVDERIRDYIVGFLKISRDEAFRVQKDYYR